MLTAFRAFLAKDLRREVRTGEMLLAVAAFGLVIMLVLSFALPRDSAEPDLVAAGALWVALLFAVQVGIARSIEVERAAGRLETIRSSPMDLTLLYLAKVLSIFIFIMVAALALLAPYAVLFNLEASALPRVALVLALGLVGLALAGTLVGLLAAASRLREILMPILFLTLFVPLLLAAVSATSAALGGEGSRTGINLLIGFDLLIGGASILLAPQLLEE